MSEAVSSVHGHIDLDRLMIYFSAIVVGMLAARLYPHAKRWWLDMQLRRVAADINRKRRRPTVRS